ncbi:hypothetical protein TNCV_2359491 [Trichonephila clavipes]|nr:hypothetical protein TNCV_2359491 [Trichonephila clavipes]
MTTLNYIELIWLKNFWKVKIFSGWIGLLKSPDRIPTEHAWVALGKAVAARNPPPRTTQDLKTELLNKWD